MKGENTLHIAIVNEDPAMVKYLLDAGADVNERCFGSFMCPEDQKASRNDSYEHEYVDVNPMTTYDGYVYWGEYPLSFAACLGQEECYRLVLARGANPDAQDTNGNTVLHMLVIYEKQETFDMAYEVGSSLGVRNSLNMTPLTLASKLGRVDMFFHIMNIEREIYWQLGSITCAAYPLSQIDTIDVETGNISKDSALNLVVFGDKDEHLELLDGVLIDLLKTKWNTFVKSRFYRQFYLFATYFLVSLVSFLLRPGPDMEEEEDDDTAAQNKTSGALISVNINSSKEQFDGSFLENATMQKFIKENGEFFFPRYRSKNKYGVFLCVENPFWFNSTEFLEEEDKPKWWQSYAECPLTNIETPTNQVITSVLIFYFKRDILSDSYNC